MTNRQYGEKFNLTKRAASKVRMGKQRTNPLSPYFGKNKCEDIEARKGVVLNKGENANVSLLNS